MFKYVITKELALKFNPNSIPTDAVNFALQLNIEFKTEEDCIKEWGTINNPLKFSPAILTKTKNGFAIFYKDNEEYKNFYILHECSHFRAFKKVCVNSIKNILLDNNANKDKCKNLQKTRRILL